MGFISLWVCVSENICMKVCLIVCLVLYILSYVLCYFIMGVCQWDHLYESLPDCVSCPVYIVIHIMSFHYGCVSVTPSVWKFAWLCVLSCIYCHTSYVISLWVCVSGNICMKVCMIVCLVLYILSYVLCYFIMGVCQWKHMLWMCVSESICMKVCMGVCLVLYILSYILFYFIMSVCQWQHLYESLHDCVSCPVYIVIHLILFHYA